MVQHGLVDFLMKHMVPGFAEDDLVLQMIMLVGAICSDAQSGYALQRNTSYTPLHAPMIDTCAVNHTKQYTHNCPSSQAGHGQCTADPYDVRPPQ